MENDILEMLEQRKFQELRDLLDRSNSADISALIDEFDGEDLILIYRLLPKEKAVDVFSYMDKDNQESLISAMTDKELRDVMDELFLDDTVDLIGEMPSNVVNRLLRHINPEQRKLINEFLNYPDGSAGSLMTIEFVDLKEHMTVNEAFAKIRKVGIDKETIYTCYVLDEFRTLIGIVSVKTLLLSDMSAQIGDIMETNFITVMTHDEIENVTKMFDKYNFLALPVVDMENKLVGIITIDDAFDALQKETTEDFEKMAAMAPSDASYFKTSVWTHAKNRIVWLLFLMISATITGTIIDRYRITFAALPLLVSFMPMIMGTGGNCGSQSVTLIIRGIALDEIKTSEYFRTLWKEMRVAFLVAIMLALVNGVRIFIQYQDIQIAMVVALALICTVVLSKSLGCSLPLLAKKLKLDPALMASPLISTIVDSCSMLIYFNIALLILRSRIG